MRIAEVEITKTGQNLVVSQASTVILSYLNTHEKLNKGQMICKKWYSRFTPQVFNKPIKLNFPISFFVNKRFRLAYYPED